MPPWFPAAAIVLLSALMLAAHLGRLEAHMVEHVDRQVNHLKGVIDMTAQDTLNAAVAQIRKGTSEVVAKIGDLQAQVDAGVPAEELDFTELSAAAQALDDIVAVAPAAVPDVEQPAEVPDVEPPAEVVGDDVADDDEV